MIIVEYEADDGRNPFREWLHGLDSQAAAKVGTAILRLTTGNTGSLKGIGDGVVECRIDWGPGYRLYFGRLAADRLVALGGGTKRRQTADIEQVKARWAVYLRSKQRRPSEP